MRPQHTFLMFCFVLFLFCLLIRYLEEAECLNAEFSIISVSRELFVMYLLGW